ncbi:GH25 family lysozyme [Acetilactobacillus jinshanensis]|uniref:Lysozyme n=1 Tax=Acetilactobacillus jinshanensis TaxID=1720083 RepID=A0A4P6ZMV7_9LACO|nr:GH25 family lysozyme [Acetilactobacillus jinshanensis]QBP18957.1 hypothetical protein ELX58_07690 [Acetilactobacillus jinshanensis]
MVKDKPLKVILSTVALALGLVLSLAIGGFSSARPANAANAYDISSYQGYVNDNQASRLKNEVNFMILKAENGGLYQDQQFDHNAYEMQKNNIPYGAYDYSTYANPAQAQEEAQALYQRAPQADFYVNDSEENDAGDQYNDSTQAWANEIHQVTRKPAILYSGTYFMNTHTTPQTRNAYDGLWVAQYGAEPNPAYHYDLWQYTDQHYSPALGESVDASVFPDGNDKPMSFWTGNGQSSDDHAQPIHVTKVTKPVKPVKPIKPVVKPIVRRHRRHYTHKVRKSASVKINTVNKKNNKKSNHNARNMNTRRNRQVRQARQKEAWQTAVRKHRRQASKLYRKTKKNVQAHKHSVKIIYNPHYYRSKRIDYLKVIGQNGINLYTMNGKYFDHVDPGTVLTVYRFMTVYHPSTGYMTKSVGIHYGHRDLFTSRKDLVQWYKYQNQNN